MTADMNLRFHVTFRQQGLSRWPLSGLWKRYHPYVRGRIVFHHVAILEWKHWEGTSEPR